MNEPLLPPARGRMQPARPAAASSCFSSVKLKLKGRNERQDRQKQLFPKQSTHTMGAATPGAFHTASLNFAIIRSSPSLL